MVKSKKEKIGILGGSFNPPHFGHLKIAKKAKELLKLDKVIFIPCGIPALPKKDLAGSKHRLEMVKLLTKFDPCFLVLDYEIKKAKRNKKSYTIETIKYLKRKFKNAELFWIIGEDSFCEIIKGKWKEASKILDLINFVVCLRGDHPFSLKNLAKKYQSLAKEFSKKVIFIKTKIPISATEIRKKIKKGQSIKNLVPKEIEEYIKAHHLYLK